ncbi:MAG: hypothetical protein KIS73_26970 [Enhydrobacter sp.]|nr:hypothetical protein [Enhydrobacter sp.]
MAKITQPSFAAGELSPSLYSRTDLAKYHIGVRTMLNWYVHPQGGASNCPGTAWVGELIDSAAAGRLIPFSFSSTDTYALEFGHLKMRVIRQGGYVLEGTHSVTGVTQANPGVVTYTGTDPSNGDRVWVASVVGMTQLNGRFFTVANVNTGANTFELRDTAGNNVNTSGYTAWSSGGTWARVYTVATPYTTADLPTLKYEQSADTMTLTHKNHAPRKLTRTDHAAWTLATITFAPTQQPPTGVVSSSAGTTHYYAVTAINDDTGEESLQSADAGSSSETSTLTWAALAGCTSYSVYKKKNGVYGFIGTAQAPASGSAVTFADATIVPDTATTPPQQRNPFGAGEFTSVTITAAGSGYSAPSAVLIDNGATVTTITLGVDGGGAITSATPAATGQRIGANAYIQISDGAGAGAILQLNFVATGDTIVVGIDGNGEPLYGPTYRIDTVTVVNGGSGYSSGVEVRAVHQGASTDATFSVTLSTGAIASVAVVSAGTATYADNTGYPTAVITDSAGTGGILTPVSTPDATVNPGVSTWHDGRQWFASSVQKPQTMWGSVSGNFNNMSQSQPTRDSDAITRTLASRQVNDIRHMVSLTQMIVLTGGAEWKVSAGTADVITPAQFVARPQSYNGSSDIKPIVVNDTLLYIPANRMKVRSLQYQWAQDSWSGTDMSLLASHLFEQNYITDWAYARDPDSICWTVRDDGVALAFTFLAEQQIFAWSRRTTTGGYFESVCAVQENDQTAVYYIIRRTINGVTKRYVERQRARVFATIANAWFLDSALRYSGSAATVISGLWHLVGEEVYALADGIVRGPLTVSAAGQVTLPVAASLVTVGKIIPDADIELLDIDGQDGAGKWTGRKKKIASLTVALKNSADQGLVAGPSGGQGTPTLYALKPKDMVNPLAAAPSTNPALVTDFMHQISAPQWDWHGRALFRVRNSPLPYTITGITPDVAAGG